jgi:hypothetical protein
LWIPARTVGFSMVRRLGASASRSNSTFPVPRLLVDSQELDLGLAAQVEEHVVLARGWGGLVLNFHAQLRFCHLDPAAQPQAVRWPTDSSLPSGCTRPVPIGGEEREKVRVRGLCQFNQVPTITTPVLTSVLASPPEGWGVDLLRRLGWVAWQVHMLNDSAEDMRYWLRATTTVPEHQLEVARHNHESTRDGFRSMRGQCSRLCATYSLGWTPDCPSSVRVLVTPGVPNAAAGAPAPAGFRAVRPLLGHLSRYLVDYKSAYRTCMRNRGHNVIN